MKPEAKVHAALWAGIAGGLVVAALAAVERPARLDRDTVALVDDVPVPRARYEDALAALAAQERGPKLDAARRRALLDALVDEELLVARGLELGLGRADPAARRRLAQLVEEHAVSRDGPLEPSDDELAAFRAAHERELGRSPTYEVEAVLVPGDGAAVEARAEAVAERWRGGESRDQLERELGAPPRVAVPRAPLPDGALREYLGPTAARVASTLEIGEVSDPIRGAGGYRVVRLVARAEGGPRPASEIAEAVRSLWRREARRERVSRYVRELRDGARVDVDTDASDDRHAISSEALARARRARGNGAMD